MKKLLLSCAALAAAFPAGAYAQSGALTPQNRTVVAPVAPPGAVVNQVAPGVFAVTPIPGVVASTKVKVQRFGDYDLNKDGNYNPMEFAQALYFLATSEPVAGSPVLPTWDRYTHRGAAQQMLPTHAIALLNATADEFAAVDMNNDWRVSPEELAAVAML